MLTVITRRKEGEGGKRERGEGGERETERETETEGERDPPHANDFQYNVSKRR